MTKDDLKDLFSKYGLIVDIACKNGFAFVEFDRIADAEDATRALHDTVQFNGKRMIVERSQESRVNSKDKCFNCGRYGHWSRECPSNREVCYRCNRPGHISRDCTVSEDLCYRCNQPGHLARECVNAPRDICYRCNQPGHIARDCSEKRRSPPRDYGYPSTSYGYNPYPGGYGAPNPYFDPYYGGYSQRRHPY